MTVTAVVLAGGRGSRLGGDKATVALAGRPLMAYPIEAARDAGLEVAVVARRSTRLPALDVPTLIESDAFPQHPLAGIVTALHAFETIVAIPCDMPLLSPGLLLRLATATAPLVVPAPAEPFPGRYTRARLAPLAQGLIEETSMRQLLVELGAVALADAADDGQLFSVNTPADLAEAEKRLTPPG